MEIHSNSTKTAHGVNKKLAIEVVGNFPDFLNWIDNTSSRFAVYNCYMGKSQVCFKNFFDPVKIGSFVLRPLRT